VTAPQWPLMAQHQVLRPETPAADTGRLSVPLWRAARRLHIAGSWLVAIAAALVLLGLITAVLALVLDQGHPHPIAAVATAVGAGVTACLMLLGGFAAQAYAQSLLEADR
jgi:drug/metabolite transporter (DMT)-like permease